MKVSVEIYSKPKHLNHTECLKKLEAEIDREENIVTLSDGKILQLNRSYFSISLPEIGSNLQPVWLYREDDYIWYLASLNNRSGKQVHVRKQDEEWILSSTNATIPSDKFDLITPTRKLIKCKQVVCTKFGIHNTSIQFVWESKKFFIRERFDGAKVRYQKKIDTELPLATICENEEITGFVYTI